MDDHVVLVGLGAVDLRVLEGLRTLGREVVVIEYDEHNR
jgi:Trk K+ transport system NAD-binding subunit